jgi:hypothetical protein
MVHGETGVGHGNAVGGRKRRRTALIVATFFVLVCASAYGGTRAGGMPGSRGPANPPTRLWNAFPLEQQTTSPQPRERETATRSQSPSRGGRTPWLWIVIGTAVALAAIIGSAWSSSRRRRDVVRFRLTERLPTPEAEEEALPEVQERRIWGSTEARGRASVRGGS